MSWRTDMAKPNPPFLSRDVDRHGNVRWYVRVPGKPKVRIRHEYDSPRFWAVYSEVRAGRIPVESSGRVEKLAAVSGSLRALCEAYYKSAEFKGLDETTRRVRRSRRFSSMSMAGRSRPRQPSAIGSGIGAGTLVSRTAPLTACASTSPRILQSMARAIAKSCP